MSPSSVPPVSIPSPLIAARRALTSSSGAGATPRSGSADVRMPRLFAFSLSNSPTETLSEAVEEVALLLLELLGGDHAAVAHAGEAAHRLVHLLRGHAFLG